VPTRPRARDSHRRRACGSRSATASSRGSKTNPAPNRLLKNGSEQIEGGFGRSRSVNRRRINRFAEISRRGNTESGPIAADFTWLRSISFFQRLAPVAKVRPTICQQANRPARPGGGWIAQARQQNWLAWLVASFTPCGRAGREERINRRLPTQFDTSLTNAMDRRQPDSQGLGNMSSARAGPSGRHRRAKELGLESRLSAAGRPRPQ